MKALFVVALLAVSAVAASPARAHHVSGTLYCDVNGNGVIDGPDTRLSGYTASAVSQTVSPGQTFTDASDATGSYYISLPARTDDYRVSLSGLPGGQVVVVPAGGSYLIHIITGNPVTDHADGVDFLVQGCAPPPTTTTTTTAATTSTTTTTVRATTTTSTSSTSTSTTTTLPPVCLCDGAHVAILARKFLKVNNDGTVDANIGVNDPGGFLRLSRNLVMPDGTLAQGDHVELGDGGSIWAVNANDFKKGLGATVRSGTIGTPILPLTSPFCPIPAFDPTCTGPDVLAQLDEVVGPIPPGVYGRLRMTNGSTLLLQSGTYTFCDVKTGQGTLIETQGGGGTTIDVGQRLQLGDGSVLRPQAGVAPIPFVNVAGKKVRLGEGTEATFFLSAPQAKLTMGRDAGLHGALCADFMKTDKHITLDCPCDP